MVADFLNSLSFVLHYQITLQAMFTAVVPIIGLPEYGKSVAVYSSTVNSGVHFRTIHQGYCLHKYPSTDSDGVFTTYR